jgi:hypothetical protein
MRTKDWYTTKCKITLHLPWDRNVAANQSDSSWSSISTRWEHFSSHSTCNIVNARWMTNTTQTNSIVRLKVLCLLGVQDPILSGHKRRELVVSIQLWMRLVIRICFSVTLRIPRKYERYKSAFWTLAPVWLINWNKVDGSIIVMLKYIGHCYHMASKKVKILCSGSCPRIYKHKGFLFFFLQYQR